jgi:hypothetical protein
VGESRFPTRIDLRAEFKDGKRLFGADDEDVRNTLRQIRSTVGGDGYVFINPDTAMPYTDIKKAFSTAGRLAGIPESALA